MINSVTTLATCWKITRKDEVVLAFTDHDRDLEIGPIVYIAKGGNNVSSIENYSDIERDNAEFCSVLDHESITENDIIAGLYDDADVEILLLDYTDVRSIIYRKKGKISTISTRNSKFVAEMTGLSDLLDKKITSEFSLKCRAEFCDKKCKLNMHDYQIRGLIIDEVKNSSSFSSHELKEIMSFGDTSDIDAGRNIKHFLYSLRNREQILEFIRIGTISIGSKYKNLSIASCTLDGLITLALPLSQGLLPGEKFTLNIGCDKNFYTCSRLFRNNFNFRGEPNLPNQFQYIKLKRSRGLLS